MPVAYTPLVSPFALCSAAAWLLVFACAWRFRSRTYAAFFGVTLMSGEILMVPEWFGLMGRPWGESAIADQQTGGGIAWGVGEIPTVLLAVFVALSWSRDDDRVAKRRDRKVDRDGDVEMDEYNAMLERLADRDGR